MVSTTDYNEHQTKSQAWSPGSSREKKTLKAATQMHRKPLGFVDPKPGERYNIEALISNNTIWGVPYYRYSVKYHQTLAFEIHRIIRLHWVSYS